MTQATPWAILLTKWHDDTTTTRARSFYEDLFTTAGTGTFNMTDYFDTMSHGKLDMSGCVVHGWFTLDENQTAYVGNSTPGPGQLGRNELLSAAKAKATANGVDLSKYFGVVVMMNTPTDLCGWVGGRAALCDIGSCEPSVLGQEIGHGYGLQHSRVFGSLADYQDPWDTMSTWDGCYMASDANYTLIGPGLNAANMRNMGWLDEARVWKAPPSIFDQQIELRPLHARGLPGNLAAELPNGDLIEFRVAQDWDSAIPRAAIFVHRLSGGCSYRMLGSAGTSDLVVGDTYSYGSQPFAWAPFATLRVDEINEQRHYAKITLTCRPRRPIPNLEIIATLLGGITVDGGGIVIIGGKPHPIDPWGPLHEIAQQLAAHLNTTTIADPIVRLDAKRSALRRIIETATAALGELNELETPMRRHNVRDFGARAARSSKPRTAKQATSMKVEKSKKKAT